MHPQQNSCSGNIVRAHTIQKRGSLERISRNDHVNTFKTDLAKILKTGKPELNLIGITKASTFTGFCSYHDNEVFKSIESGILTINEETCFLLGYRVLCHEIFLKSAFREQLLYTKNNLDKGKSLSRQFQIQDIKPVVIFGLRSDYAHAIPSQKIPEGLTSLKAESCGQCHREIYEEWKTSIHAHAYEDPFFQAYWKKDKHIWVCLNCHTPLENQQPTLVKEIPRGRVEKASQEPTPHFDAALQKAAITCAACHVRDGVILGPFDDSAAPHPTQFNPSFRTAQFCSRCHNVVSGPAQFYNVGPCGTYAEYEGKYFMEERGMHIITFKCIFGHNKKRTAVKVKVKEMRAFYPCTELSPTPAPATPVILDPELFIR